ncbi:hypothetical protein HPB49_009037 [Dermacentor silvarum]|uniref:Uncharacterized protein n=1 Tax=Dermacentor silvarum TaxID=543639 RepID=A0ACB8DY47_DERSI|nr:hypothetical protein HPB49_009037 [Dermacentor silvarum]
MGEERASSRGVTFGGCRRSSAPDTVSTLPSSTSTSACTASLSVPTLRRADDAGAFVRAEQCRASSCGSVARMWSPTVLPSLSGGGRALRFAYKLFGDNRVYLRLLMRPAGPTPHLWEAWATWRHSFPAEWTAAAVAIPHSNGSPFRERDHPSVKPSHSTPQHPPYVPPSTSARLPWLLEPDLTTQSDNVYIRPSAPALNIPENGCDGSHATLNTGLGEYDQSGAWLPMK